MCFSSPWLFRTKIHEIIRSGIDWISFNGVEWWISRGYKKSDRIIGEKWQKIKIIGIRRKSNEWRGNWNSKKLIYDELNLYLLYLNLRIKENGKFLWNCLLKKIRSKFNPIKTKGPCYKKDRIATDWFYLWSIQNRYCRTGLNFRNFQEYLQS